MPDSFTIPVPFTVIGGFLGSGKTTLLNYLLSQSKGIRFAVLVNDFGDLNIDKSLISSHDGQTISLANGCVCCSISNDFNQTMINLVKRIEEFDQVVVEASGVSEPARIMDIARLDPELSPSGIVVLVDAAEVQNFSTDRYISNTVLKQLQTAELLIVNKIDLVSKEKLAELEAWLEEVSPTAFRLKTSGGVVPVEMIFGGQINSKRFNDKSDGETNRTKDSNYPHHNHQFKSLTLNISKQLNRKTFELWCNALPQSVIRGKGLLRFRDDPEHLWIWQKVGKHSSFKKSIVKSEISEVLLIGTAEMPVSLDLDLSEGLEKIRCST